MIEKNGFKFEIREGTSDTLVVREVIVEDCYRFNELNLTKGLVLDVGANIGTFSVLAGQKNKVIAYEPEPNNYELLIKNIKLNKAKVVAHELGLGIGGYSTIDDQQGGSRLGSGEHDVETISLTEALKDIKEIDFMKMDCEGSEYPIILAASGKTLKKIKRFAFEVHPDLVDKDTHQRFMARLASMFLLEITGNIPNGAGGILYGVRQDV